MTSGSDSLLPLYDTHFTLNGKTYWSWLTDICVKWNLQLEPLKLVPARGFSSQNPLYLGECVVLYKGSPITTKVTELTKKRAQHMSAYQMLVKFRCTPKLLQAKHAPRDDCLFEELVKAGGGGGAATSKSTQEPQERQEKAKPGNENLFNVATAAAAPMAPVAPAAAPPNKKTMADLLAMCDELTRERKGKKAKNSQARGRGNGDSFVMEDVRKKIAFLQGSKIMEDLANCIVKQNSCQKLLTDMKAELEALGRTCILNHTSFPTRKTGTWAYLTSLNIQHVSICACSGLSDKDAESAIEESCHRILTFLMEFYTDPKYAPPAPAPAP